MKLPKLPKLRVRLAWLCPLVGHALPKPTHLPPGLTLRPKCPRCGQRVTVRT